MLYSRTIKQLFTASVCTLGISLSAHGASSLQVNEPSSKALHLNKENSERNWIVEVDWLNWTLKEDVLNIATVIDASKSGNATITDGNTLKPNFTFNSGYRIQVTRDFTNNWRINAIWASVPGQGNTRSVTSTNPAAEFVVLNNIDFPIFNNPALPALTHLSSFQSQWDIRASVFDLNLSYKLMPVKSFAFLPHVGFRASWNHQKFAYAGFAPLIAAPTNKPANIYGEFTENFSGYGVSGGMWGVWQLGHGLSLLGHFGGALTYASFNIQQKLSVAPIVNGQPVLATQATIHNTPSTGTPMLDYFLGAQYTKPLRDMNVSVRCGFEQHIQMFVSRNLTAQGLTLGGAVAF